MVNSDETELHYQNDPVPIIESGQYPKVIWSYWHNDNLPKVVMLCLMGWKKYNPDYSIIMLSKTNYTKYLDIPNHIINHPNFNDCLQRFSDLLRLYVLNTYGGVWLDSSILLKEPLSQWMTPNDGQEYAGFYINGFTIYQKYPVIENWFMMCVKDSQFIKLWLNEFLKLSNYETIMDYLNSRKDMGVNFQNIMGPSYLTMHISAQKILQIDQYPISKLFLKKAEDSAFKYLVDSQWNSQKALELACNNPTYQLPIIKMRGSERKILQTNYEELSNDKCHWI